MNWIYGWDKTFPFSWGRIELLYDPFSYVVGISIGCDADDLMLHLLVIDIWIVWKTGITQPDGRGW